MDRCDIFCTINNRKEENKMNNLMITYWGPGSFAGLIVGAIVIAVFVFVALKIAKKDGANLEAILANVSEAADHQRRFRRNRQKRFLHYQRLHLPGK